jgi:hypothetical protein
MGRHPGPDEAFMTWPANRVGGAEASRIDRHWLAIALHKGAVTVSGNSYHSPSCNATWHLDQAERIAFIYEAGVMPQMLDEPPERPLPHIAAGRDKRGGMPWRPWWTKPDREALSTDHSPDQSRETG